MSWLPKVRVAACNVSPVFLDTAKTVQKTVGLIQEAARNRADLVVFPETYIPAYPLWAGLAAPIDNHHFFTRLAHQSLLITGPEIRTLRQTCAQAKIFAHIGFNERSSASVGCLWNSAVLISDKGEILNHQRKLVPTWYEKLIWANGDGAGLRVVDTERCGKVGALLCGENTNPLARWSLMAQGEQLHITTWPPVWPTRRVSSSQTQGSTASSPSKQYDNLAANRTRTSAHCFEAKCFGVMSSMYMDKVFRDEILAAIPSAEETLDSLTQGASLFIDPTGTQVGESVVGEEGIAYADLDLNACVEPKQFHDVVGYYQRFDVFDLKVNRERLEAQNAFRDDEVVAEVGERASAVGSDETWSQESTREPSGLGHGVGGLKVL
ncbi:carbon-nitrogen hydrolase [Neohortaea acidophila]|uniref:Carbon-nitrogen hydrolase n=1 Tax=Neohortaea acidophila TaxID=245834 RepID=A0A6A6Q4Y5_9PEZI|nr:carbon-nitrogen hydrolase [Neohortaea acidophila]KAF2487362.1 carbon-nitrogen hydrolase [Neohortaea acidophila]